VHYYQHHIGDYLSHTASLSLLEHGVYLRLLQCYYMADGYLAGCMYRAVGARSAEEKEAVDYILATYFTVQDGVYKQAGADKRIAEFNEKSNKARKAVEVRWNNKRNTDVSESDTDVSENDTNGIQTNNHKPITNNQKTKTQNTAPAKAVAVLNPKNTRIDSKGLIARVPGLIPQVADDFLTVRKAKRAPLTATALALIEAEAANAGITTAQAIAIATARGWQSFKADWIKTGQPQDFVETHTDRSWAEGL
jgi:uncharacterized protein YdaU (DUF1376 family)